MQDNTGNINNHTININSEITNSTIDNQNKYVKTINNIDKSFILKG